jgi:hypothetical protein
MTDDLTTHLIALEHARCAAISSGDRAALEELTGDEVSFTHSTGFTEDRAAHLDSLGAYERQLTRGDDLKVRFYGDTAVMTGTLKAHFPKAGLGDSPVDFDCHAIGVWVKQDQSWKHVAFASSGQLPEALAHRA